MGIAEELQRLQDLRASGAITEAEFSSAKAMLLAEGATNGGPARGSEEETRRWAMLIHLSQFAGWVVPLAGFVLPIVLWQIKKDDLPGIDAHGKMVTNWILSVVLYGIVSAILVLVLIGLLGLLALGVMAIVFPIIGGVKANEGELWPYPLTIRFIR